MKTAISLPDKLFYVAEKYAKEHGLSRSRLYSTAINEFIEKNTKKDVTQQINKVCENLDTSLNPLIQVVGKRVLLDSEW